MNKKKDLEAFLSAIDAHDTGRRNYRYVYFAAETDEWYALNKKDVQYGVLLHSRKEDDWYSHWCAGCSYSAMSQKTVKKLRLTE